MREWNPPLQIADGHCDTLWMAPKQQRTLGTRSSAGHLDVPRLVEAGVVVQFFALFSDPAYGHAGYTVQALRMAEQFYQTAETSDGVLQPLLWREDVDQAQPGRVLGLLSIEGAEPLHGYVDALRLFFRLGVRAMGLTWNYRNELADGQLESVSNSGLTPRGRAVVAEMERLGMLIDCSHLSDSCFWDLMEHTTGPVIASHSNARAVTDHLRNLTDDQIKCIAARGGVIGINFARGFLTAQKVATVDDVIRHIDHISALVGPRYITLGTDYDGISQTPAGLDDVTCLPRLADALSHHGYDDATVRLIMGGNWLRLLKTALPSRPQQVHR